MARHTEIVRYRKAFIEYSEGDSMPEPSTVEQQQILAECLRNIDQGSTLTLIDIVGGDNEN